MNNSRQSSGLQVFRSSGLQVFRSSGLQVFRSSGLPRWFPLTAPVSLFWLLTTDYYAPDLTPTD
jgi:hypothetical protein